MLNKPFLELLHKAAQEERDSLSPMTVGHDRVRAAAHVVTKLKESLMWIEECEKLDEALAKERG